MKLSLIFCLLLFGALTGVAQIDNNSSSVRFDSIDDDFESPTGFEMPATKLPSLTDPKDPINPYKNSTLGKEKKEPLDITKGDGLIDYTTNKTPKFFTKDKEAKSEYGRDQSLGEVITKSQFVNVRYRDHEYVDGDVIRVFVNGDVVRSSVVLEGTFRGFKLPLQSGFNRVEFQALNQGESGPNTAELHVYDDNGVLVSAKEWNLLTGRKATIIVVKE